MSWHNRRHPGPGWDDNQATEHWRRRQQQKMWQEQNMRAPWTSMYDEAAGYPQAHGFIPPSPRPPVPPFMPRPVMPARMQRDDDYQVDIDVPPFKKVKTGHESSSTDAHGSERWVS